MEHDQRLVSGRRGHHSPEALLDALTASGAAALGWDAGRLEPGRLADFVAVDLTSVRLAGWSRDDLLRQVVYGATATDVTDVVVGGRQVVSGRRHAGRPEAGASLHEAVRRLLD